MAISTAYQDNRVDITFPEKLIFRSASGSLAPTTNTLSDISSANDGFAVPLTIHSSLTIDYIDIYLISGTAGDLRCRIVNLDSAHLPNTSNLADANADKTISSVGGSSGWVRFDYTNFILPAGHYYIVITATSEGAFDINLGISDWTRPNYLFDSGNRALSFDGTDWNQYWDYAPLIRLMSTNGYVQGSNRYFGFAGEGTGYIMDTLENPSCRGTGITLPYSGHLTGVWACFGGYTANTSVDVVMVAASDPSTVLARTEVDSRQKRHLGYAGFVPFSELVEVSGGEDYYVYFTAGANASTIGGVYLYRVDFTDDPSLVEIVGIQQGGLYGIEANAPPSEGGSDTWTTTSGKCISIAVQYGQIQGATTKGENLKVW